MSTGKNMDFGNTGNKDYLRNTAQISISFDVNEEVSPDLELPTAEQNFI